MKNAIPNIRTTDYSIALTNTAANLIPQKSTVGEISNVKKNKTVAYIILDDEYIKKSNMRDILVTYLKDNSQEPIHLIYRDFLRSILPEKDFPWRPKARWHWIG